MIGFCSTSIYLLPAQPGKEPTTPFHPDPTPRLPRARLVTPKANGKPGKSYVCATLRKLIHIAFAILKSGKPFDPNYGLA